MYNENNLKYNLKFLVFCGLFLIIILSNILETITYPGLFLNKIGISLAKLTFILSLPCIILYFFVNKLQTFNKYQKILTIVFSLTILITLILTIIESFTYPNFVFSKLHLNYKALQTLSYFFSSFVFLLLINKIKKTKNQKLLLIILICLTPLLSYLSWNQHLSTSNILNSETQIIPNIKKLEKDRQIAFKSQLTQFFKPIDNYGQIKIFSNLFTISFFTLFLIITILYSLSWIQNKNSLRIKIILLFFYLGSIAYIFLIIFICTVMFSLGELKVFQGRYILTYFLALIMFSFYLYANNLSKLKTINTSFLFYTFILLILINSANLTNLKPINEKDYLERKNKEILYSKVKKELQKNEKPILHTINGEGAIGFRYYLTPINILTPIWQEWDVFMFTNPAFSKATHVFLSKATDVSEKLNNNQIKQIFGDENKVIDNSLYKIVRVEDNFQLELVTSLNYD